MARVLVLVGLCHACSSAWHDARVHASPTAKLDCPSYIRPALDLIGAGSFAFVASEAFIHRNDADSAANLFVVPFALAAAAFAASTVYGFVEPGRCQRRQAELAEQRQEQQRRALEAVQRTDADRALLHRANAREHAWIRTRAAADAARRGDCVAVRAASANVVAVDSEFHATVFVRDAAIARCLAPDR